jgi:hypothetical protein
MSPTLPLSRRRRTRLAPTNPSTPPPSPRRRPGLRRSTEPLFGCWRRTTSRTTSAATGDVELGAALALADMAAAGSTAGAGLSLGPTPTPAKRRDDDPVPAAKQKQRDAAGEQSMSDEEEMASTRLSLELGKASIHSSSCSSSGERASSHTHRGN